MERLKKLVPPRVTAALVRTWFNDWCTTRRFQLRDRAKCYFGCQECPDDLEHYSCCKCIGQWANRRIGCETAVSVVDRRKSFLLLDGDAVSDEELVANALRLTVAYMAYNGARHRSETGAGLTRNSLEQYIKEAAAGHPTTMRVVRQRGPASRGKTPRSTAQREKDKQDEADTRGGQEKKVTHERRAGRSRSSNRGKRREDGREGASR